MVKTKYGFVEGITKGALMRDIFSRFAYTGELNRNQYNGKDDIYII